MTLACDPRKIFIIVAIILILVYGLLRIRQHMDDAYNRQNADDHSEIIYSA